MNRSNHKQPEDISELLKSLQDFKTKNEEELLKISINEEEDEKTLTRSKYDDEGTLTNASKTKIQASYCFSKSMSPFFSSVFFKILGHFEQTNINLFVLFFRTFIKFWNKSSEFIENLGIFIYTKVFHKQKQIYIL